MPGTWALLAATAALVRLPALLHRGPIDDETVYAVVARVMLDGGLPYLDAIERKPPLLFGVYWAVFELFGAYSWLALHLVALGWVLLTMLGLYVLARRLFGARAGAVAALAYALFQPFAIAKNLAFNGEVLMNLPLVWGYALVVGRAGGRRAWARSAAAGALMALAFLLKQPAAIAAVPLGLYLLLQRAGCGRGARAIRFVSYNAAFWAVLGACALILLRHGMLREALYWTVLDHDVPHVFWQRAGAHSALFVAFALPVVLPLITWRTLARRWRERGAEWYAVLGWAMVSVVGAAAGGRFYPHYYIQLIPPLALLAAPVYAWRTGGPRVDRPRALSPRFAAVWLGLSAVATLTTQVTQLYLRGRPPEAAPYVRAHSSEDDRLFAWGQATRMYIDADRLPASRYIATFPLTGFVFGERIPGVSTRDRILPGAWKKLAADLAARPPRFIIDTQARPGADYPIADYPYLARLVRRDYRRVAVLRDGVVYERCRRSPCRRERRVVQSAGGCPRGTAGGSRERVADRVVRRDGLGLLGARQP